MKSWVWLSEALIYAIHEEQLAEHGGATGIRDAGLLASALARPKNLLGYETHVDVAMLAASYAYGIAKNHPFVDGNKRTAFVALELFLVLNGWVLLADDAQAVLMMLALAASEMDELELIIWIRQHSVLA